MHPLGGGGGWSGADRAAARAVVVLLPASSTRTPSPFTSRRSCGSLRPPVLGPRRHGHWHVLRAGRAGTGLVKRCDTDTSRQVLAWAPPSARGGADSAPVCPLRLGQPIALGWSGWARLLCSTGARLRWAPLLPLGARSRPTEVRRPRGSGCGMPVYGERRVACRGALPPGGARSWPAGVALPCGSRRLGRPGAVRRTGDPSPGREECPAAG